MHGKWRLLGGHVAKEYLREKSCCVSSNNHTMRVESDIGKSNIVIIELRIGNKPELIICIGS